jgi:putative phosphotransacetylase
MKKILIEVSARHLHLSKADAAIIFGEGYNFNFLKKLSQPEYFSTQETVRIVYQGEKGEKSLENLRIIIPFKEKTQLELAKTDARSLGADPPVRLSGNIEKTPGFKIIGPAGELVKNEGMIIAKRHLHISTEEAKEFNLKNGAEINVRAGEDGERELVFHKVVVRVADNFKLAMHIDTDEGNAAGISGHCLGEII